MLRNEEILFQCRKFESNYLYQKIMIEQEIQGLRDDNAIELFFKYVENYSFFEPIVTPVKKTYKNQQALHLKLLVIRLLYKEKSCARMSA